MSKAVIGIVSSLSSDEINLADACKNVSIRNAYVQSVVNSGGIPMVLPPVESDELIEEMIGRVDGLLVPGGNDLRTQLFGEEPELKQGSFSPERDHLDLVSIRTAFAQHKPILGICRGIQAINVCFGGTLYQDLSDNEAFTVQHSQNGQPRYGSHTVAIRENSVLFPLLGEKFLANSFHHQAVKRVADGFHVTAVALDGVIEAIERDDENFALGIQWHPEMMATAGDEKTKRIFDLFVKACGE